MKPMPRPPRPATSSIHSTPACPPRKRACASPSCATPTARPRCSKWSTPKPLSLAPKMPAKMAAYAIRPRWPISKLSRERCEPMTTDLDRKTTANRQPVLPPAALKARCLLAAAIMLPMLLLPGCKKEAPPETIVTVQAEHPEQGPIAEHITVDAILTPLAQAAIAPKITAPVRKFYVQRGAKVKEGELLATLENSDLAAAALDNKGSYEAAQAAFATATKAQVPEDTQKAELDVAQAKANLDLNLGIVKSRKQLFAEGAIPGRDLDTAQAALVQAHAAYDTAAKHLESVRSVSREAALKSAQGQLTSAEGKM